MDDESTKNIIRSFLNDIEGVKDKAEKYLSFCFHAMSACVTKREFGHLVWKYRRMYRRPAH